METNDQLNKGVFLTIKFISQSDLFAINTSFVADLKSTNFIFKNGFCKSCFKAGKSSIEKSKK